jgi:hypothetical protein
MTILPGIRSTLRDAKPKRAAEQSVERRQWQTVDVGCTEAPVPRTPEGLARSKKANWKHGLYSLNAKAERRFMRQLLEDSRKLLQEL